MHRRRFPPAPRAGILTALALVAGLSVSTTARADEPLPPTPDTNPSLFPQTAAQPNLIVIGAVVTAGWYGAAVGTSYLWSDSPSAPSLRIPVAGPYMALAKTGCGEAEPECGTFSVVIRTIFTSLSLVGQTGGTLAMIEGIFLGTSNVESDVKPKAKPRLKRSPEKAHVSVLPTNVGTDGVGVGVFASF